MITPDGHSIVSRRRVGERYATRVRIAAPQGSRYNGQRGVVVDILETAGTLMVQLGPGLVLPFGFGEVEVIEERSRYQ